MSDCPFKVGEELLSFMSSASSFLFCLFLCLFFVCEKKGSGLEGRNRVSWENVNQSKFILDLGTMETLCQDHSPNPAKAV